MTDSTRLAADTAMGPVTLNVADLDAMAVYYRDAIGLDVLEEGVDRRTLGRDGAVVLVLVATPELKHAGPREAGLFHTAFLFDSREALAAAVYQVARRHPGSFTGSADHLVSLAFYFDDPEHNGVELYWDRDRTAWSWAHGTIEMGSLQLDPNAFLQEHLTEEGADAPLRVGPGAGLGIGHVHLSVGDVESARAFYVEQLGFDETAAYPGAVFVSAGGYHHHMAMNVWNSRGAGRRQPTLGLGRVEIVVPGADDVGALRERIAHHGVPVADDGRTVAFDDPWGNRIQVETAL